MKAKRSLVWLLCIAMLACTVDQVLTDLNLLISIAGAIIPAVGQLSPADAAFVSKISGIATQGIAVIQTDYDAFKGSGAASDLAKVQSAINILQANLTAELSAAHVSNPATVAKITAWVNLISTTLNAILAALPQAGVIGARPGPVPTKAQIQARWQMEVCGGDASCAALVK